MRQTLTEIKIKALTLVLTIIALVAGHSTAMATSKTVTYTFTYSSNQLTFTPNNSGFGTSTGTKVATINTQSTSGFDVQLDDGVTLRLSLKANSSIFFVHNGDNPQYGISLNTNGDQQVRFFVSCTDYYITHVKLAQLNGTTLVGTGTPAPLSSGPLDVDVDIDKATYNNSDYNPWVTTQNTNFGQLTITLSDTPRPYTLTYVDAVDGVRYVTNTNPTTYNVATPEFQITAPTRTGYTFEGFYNNANFSGSPEALPLTIERGQAANMKDRTFYAKWSVNDYTVTLDNQSATTAGTTEVTATFDATMPSITVPTRTGYTFGGYYTETDGGGTKYYNADGTSAHTWDIASATTLYAQWLSSTVTVTTAEEFIAAVKNTSVTKIILGADITPPNQIYTKGSIEEGNLEETEIPNSACFVITRKEPLTIDLAGHKISGTNDGTGIAKTIPTSTYASGYAAGILSLHGANVTLMDSYGGGEIKNTHNGSAYVIVANPATLVINDGITIDSTNGKSYGLYVYSAGESHITINDAVITGNRPLHGYVGSTYKNSTLTINGGTFTGTGSLGIFGNGPSALTSFGTMEVNGGTFITTYENSSFFGYLGDTKFATGGTFYGFDDDNKLNQLAQLVPDNYSVKVTAKPAGSDYLGEAVYEIVPTADCDFVATRLINRKAGGGTVDFGVESGTDVGLLLGYDSSNAAVQVKRIYVTDDCALNVSGFGHESAARERYLFVDIPAGKTVTGDITMKYGTITFTGEGTFSGTVTSADESKYAIEYDAETKTYTAGVPDSELGLTVTKLNGTVKRFTKTEAGDVVRGYSYTVESGDVFKLYADISCTGSLKNYPNNYSSVADPNYTIDLNGYELKYIGTSSTFAQIYVSSATKVSTLNLIDTSANGGGVFDGTSCSFAAIAVGYAANSPSATNLKYGGAVVVGEGVTVKGCVLVSGRSTFDLYGNLEFNTSSDMPINSNNKWSQVDQRITLHSGATVSNTEDAAIRIPQYCTFIVEDGATVIGKNYGIESLHGDLHIAPGAVITATDGPALKINTNTTYTLGVTVDIKGGTFTSKAGVAPITSTGNSAVTGKPVTGFIAPAAKGDVVLSEAISEALLANWYRLEDWENDTKTVARFRKQLSSTDITVADIPNQTYSGTALTPAVTVTDGTTELTKDKDYTVSPETATDAGTYTVTITGIGNYDGTMTKTFTIDPAPLTITAADASKAAGQADPTFSASITFGTLVTGQSISYSYTREEGETAGTYAITPSATITIDASCDDVTANYDITAVDGTLTISYYTAELADNADNTSIIKAHNGETVNVVLLGRTFWKDGDWNTLCLPFSLSAEQIAASDLAGADIRTLSSSSFSNGKLTLNFTPAAPTEGAVTSISAGVPYIFKWDEAATNIVNPTFTGVTISNTTANVETTYVTFKGTYSPVTFDSEDKSILLVGEGNTLYYPQSGASLKAFRAYFQLNNGLTVADISNTRMNFGDGNEVTEVIEFNASLEVNDESWYDMSGRKLDGKPTAKGLYIYKGRKVAIK